MEKEEIRDGKEVLAFVVRGKDWQPGLNFFSAEQDYEQVGIWSYDKGKVLNAHRHLPAPRTALLTQEVIFLRKGRLKATIYSEANKPLTSVQLVAGDILVLLAGGHGYEGLEDGTQVLEIKNGPYVGADKDRER